MNLNFIGNILKKKMVDPLPFAVNPVNPIVQKYRLRNREFFDTDHRGKQGISQNYS